LVGKNLKIKICKTVILPVVLYGCQTWSLTLGFDSRRRLGIFLFTTASRTALGPTQPSIQCVEGPLSLGIKRPGRESDRSPPSSAEIKEWA
jgi:hypothetical protein